MDFVDWCDRVLKTFNEARRAIPIVRTHGALDSYIASVLFGQEIASRQDFRDSILGRAMLDALSALDHAGLIVRNSPYWKITTSGMECLRDPISFWQDICQMHLEPEQEQLLRVVNRLSPQISTHNAVWRDGVRDEILLAELGWVEGADLLWPIADDLEEMGFIVCNKNLGPLFCWVTYRGLAWETRRGLTLESKVIDDLVAEWETTSVDFKQYLYLNTVEQKAEFIKDILSLANTKASGRRWMIIGFHNKTHDYFGPPNPDVNQDDLERLIGEYTDPHVNVKYDQVAYKKGLVGKLEILRDPRDVPYRVAKSLGEKLKGDKKQIFKGVVYVRHGSQVVVARGTELKDLLEERKRALSNSQA